MLPNFGLVSRDYGMCSPYCPAVSLAYLPRRQEIAMTVGTKLVPKTHEESLRDDSFTGLESLMTLDTIMLTFLQGANNNSNKNLNVTLRIIQTTLKLFAEL